MRSIIRGSLILCQSTTFIREQQGERRENRKEGREEKRVKRKRTIIIIVTNHHLLHLAVVAHLAPKVLVEGVKVVLQLRGVHLVLGVVGRVLVQVGQQDRLRVRGLDVFARAPIAVPARTDLVVEGAVDL